MEQHKTFTPRSCCSNLFHSPRVKTCSLLHPLTMSISHILFFVLSHSSLSSCPPSSRHYRAGPAPECNGALNRSLHWWLAGKECTRRVGSDGACSHIQVRRCEHRGSTKISSDCLEEVLMNDPSKAADRLACSLPRSTRSPCWPLRH